MSDEGSSSTTTTTFGWSSSRKVVRRFPACIEQTTQRWTVGLFSVSWTSWRTLRISKKFSFSRTQRDEVCCKLACHDTRRNRLCGHGGYRGTTPQFHAPRVDSASFRRDTTWNVIRKREVLSAHCARLRSWPRSKRSDLFFFFFFFVAKGGLRATCKPREVRAWPTFRPLRQRWAMFQCCCAVVRKWKLEPIDLAFAAKGTRCVASSQSMDA